MLGARKQPTRIAGGFKRPLEEAKFFLVYFFLSFSIFLILDILSDLGFIQTDGADAVPSVPEVVSPVRFFFRVEKLLKSLIAVFPFNIPITSDTDNLGGIESMRWI